MATPPPAPTPVLPSALPEPYCGDSSKPWSDWLAHYEACATALAWDNALKLRYVSSHLRGLALTTYSALPSSGKVSWTTASKALTSAFEPASNRQLYAAQYRNRRQQLGEDPVLYATALRRLGQHALPNDLSDTARDKLVVEQYVDGLADSRIRLSLRENWPASVEAAVTRTLELQAAREAELLTDHAQPTIAAVQADATTTTLEALTKAMGLLITSQQELTAIVKNSIEQRFNQRQRPR